MLCTQIKGWVSYGGSVKSLWPGAECEIANRARSLKSLLLVHPRSQLPSHACGCFAPITGRYVAYATTEGIEIGMPLPINRVCGGSIMRQIRKIPLLVDPGGYGQRLLPLRAGMSGPQPGAVTDPWTAPCV